MKPVPKAPWEPSAAWTWENSRDSLTVARLRIQLVPPRKRRRTSANQSGALRNSLIGLGLVGLLALLLALSATVVWTVACISQQLVQQARQMGRSSYAARLGP